MLMREKLARIANANDLPFEIRFPSERGLDQDEEWCEVRLDPDSDDWHRIRFHDYHEVYTVPGLYEAIFYELLECSSPKRVAGLLEDVLSDHKDEPNDLKVLDLGAGNGMVGEELKSRGARKIVGIDIIPEAKEATLRDRPKVYEDYLVTDLTDLPERQEEHLRRTDLNCLSTVAALGFGDIPADAFIKGLDIIDTPGWLAFNIKEDFIHEQDTSGFSQLIRRLSRQRVIRIEAWRRYCHRLAITGEPLYYVAMVARKLEDLPDEYLDRDEPEGE